MRTVKFRAKNRHTGEWLYGDYHRVVNAHYITTPKSYSGAHAPIEFIVNEKTLGQFVGLVDKAGIEIYEGDIVRTDVGACNFADGAAGEVTFLRIVGYNDNAAFEPFSEFKYEHYDWEVIGNIHDRIITYDGKKYTAKVLPYKKGEDYCAKCPLDPDKCRLGFSFNVCEIFDYLQDEDTIQVLKEVHTNPELLKEGEK